MNAILKPQHKNDRRICAYLGPDASLVVMFKRTVLEQTIEYAQIGQLPNVGLEIHGGQGYDHSTADWNTPGAGLLSRIVLNDEGMAALLIVLADTGSLVGDGQCR